jgi:hypothetical protein
VCYQHALDYLSIRFEFIDKTGYLNLWAILCGGLLGVMNKIEDFEKLLKVLKAPFENP